MRHLLTPEGLFGARSVRRLRRGRCSTLSLGPVAGATAYSCSKAAQVALAKMAALELAKDGIRVNVICPGLVGSNIETTKERRHLERAQEPMEFPAGKVPLTDGRPGKADDIAELVLFLATQRRSGHITGTPLWIDGAESLLQG